jgi:hypothetical protein
MSNNKQNSVEWLFEEQFNSFEKFNNGGFSFSEYMAHNLTLREQAKAMHKEEIIDSFGVGCQVEASRLIGYHKMAEQYYNETFGGNK